MNRMRTTGPVAVDYVIRGRDDEVIGFYGTALGFATSQRDLHDHDVTCDENGVPDNYAPPGERCSACRWFEVRIYSVQYELLLPKDYTVHDTTDTEDFEQIDRRGRYLVVTAGMSVVPGEITMRRASWTDSAYEVLELLTQRRSSTPFLPGPSARALAQAATWDSGINSAYIQRQVR